MKNITNTYEFIAHHPQDNKWYYMAVFASDIFYQKNKIIEIKQKSLETLLFFGKKYGI